MFPQQMTQSKSVGVVGLSPKRKVFPPVGRERWYPYYAGYSTTFARAALNSVDLGSEDYVLDPWNGSGTTTQAAEDLGLRSFGIDVNPVMVVVSKARLLGRNVVSSLQPLCETIIEAASRSNDRRNTPDPLDLWLVPSSARHVRAIAMAIHSTLVDEKDTLFRSLDHLDEISSLGAFFYVALFRCFRKVLGPFVGTNPTWIKTPKHYRERVGPTWKLLSRLFRAQVEEMALVCAEDHTMRADLGPHEQFATVLMGNATKLPFANGFFQAVVGSPPYCTRIDYAVSTRPELSVLGFDSGEFRRLRETMMGTSTIGKSIPEIHDGWGPACVTFLERVATHYSKASASYYLKNHLQYFHALYSSLVEIDRVLDSKGRTVLVIQDSYYKEIHNDLPLIVLQMGDGLGWSKMGDETHSGASMGWVNKGSRSYRTATAPTERVLVFQKVG
jgi:SAM-dependent methyltransferase